MKLKTTRKDLRKAARLTDRQLVEHLWGELYTGSTRNVAVLDEVRRRLSSVAANNVVDPRVELSAEQ